MIGFEHIHFVGVCGRAMGAIAAELLARGCVVTGSDQRALEPMKSFVESRGILLIDPGDPLPPETQALILNAWEASDHPQVVDALARGLPVMSFAQLLGEQFLHKSTNLVVAGTNGKTTTTAILTWILEHAGFSPDFLIGGKALNLKTSARLQASPWFVLEGDEYPASSIDPSPKFAYYAPHTLVITNIAHDHPEVFASPHDYLNVFKPLARNVPADGSLILNADQPELRSLAAECSAQVSLVGFSSHADLPIGPPQVSNDGRLCRFRFLDRHFHMRGHGRMNAQNAAMAIAAAQSVGVKLDTAAEALQSFRGVAGRQEMVAHGKNVTVYLDEAYHPDAIAALVESIRSRHRDRRLVFVFLPRYTGSSSDYAQNALPAAFHGVGAAILMPAYLPESQQDISFDNDRLRSDLEDQGCRAVSVNSLPELIAAFKELLQPGDVVIVSVGFGKPQLHSELKQVIDHLNEMPA